MESHRNILGGRAAELLDSLRAEVDSLTRDCGVYKMQRDDMERKLQQQVNELTTIQQALFDLERSHTKMKQQYEEEINRLCMQLGQAESSRISSDLVPSSSSSLTVSMPPAATSAVVASRAPAMFPILSPLGTAKQATKLHIEAPKMDTTVIPSKPGEDRDLTTKDWLVGYNPTVPTDLSIDLQHTLMHNSVVCCVRFSSDGKYLATGCNHSAQIYDVDTGRRLSVFVPLVDRPKKEDQYIRSVCFSPDGQYLATGAEDMTIKLWHIQSKRIVNTFVGHDLDIYSLDFSRDGRFIVSGSGDKKAKIWDLEKGRCIYTLGTEELGPRDGVTSVAFSPDDRHVVAGSLDRVVRMWSANTGYFIESFESHTDSVYTVSFSPDGKLLASGALDKTIKLWDLQVGKRQRPRCRNTLNGHKDYVLSVCFSPDGNWIVSGSKDRSVQFWDPQKGATHLMLQGHRNSVISVALSPLGGIFATGSGDFRSRIWKYSPSSLPQASAPCTTVPASAFVSSFSSAGVSSSSSSVASSSSSSSASAPVSSSASVPVSNTLTFGQSSSDQSSTTFPRCTTAEEMPVLPSDSSSRHGMAVPTTTSVESSTTVFLASGTILTSNSVDDTEPMDTMSLDASTVPVSEA